MVFVLCWLPFHIGRTIFSLSQGSGIEGQDVYLGTNTPVDVDTHPGVGVDRETFMRHTEIGNGDPQAKADGGDGTDTTTVSDTEGQCIKSCTHTDLYHSTSVNAVGHTNTHSEIDRNLNRKLHVHKQLGEYKDHHRHNATDMNKCAMANDSAQNRKHSKHGITRVNRQNGDVRQTTAPTHLYGNTNTVTDSNLHATANTDPYDRNINNDTLANHAHNTTLYILYYVSQYINLVSFVLFYLSAAINPLLYNLMSVRYRQAVHSLVRTRAGSGRGLQLHHPSTTTM